MPGRLAASDSRSARKLCLWLLLLTGSGCSFLGVRPTPQPNRHSGHLECKSKLPVVDLVGASAVAVAFAAGSHLSRLGAALCEPRPGYTCSEPTSATPGLFAAGVLAASSLYGFAMDGKCRAKLQELEQQGHLSALDAEFERLAEQHVEGPPGGPRTGISGGQE